MVSPVHSLPVDQNETAGKATHQNAASQPATAPQDKVTLSPQAQAQIAEVHTQQTATTVKAQDGASK